MNLNYSGFFGSTSWSFTNWNSFIHFFKNQINTFFISIVYNQVTSNNYQVKSINNQTIKNNKSLLQRNEVYLQPLLFQYKMHSGVASAGLLYCTSAISVHDSTHALARTFRPTPPPTRFNTSHYLILVNWTTNTLIIIISPHP